MHRNRGPTALAGIAAAKPALKKSAALVLLGAPVSHELLTNIEICQPDMYVPFDAG